nr:unnamed protein product [Spirometra erinaceieuropaei]
MSVVPHHTIPAHQDSTLPRASACASATSNTKAALIWLTLNYRTLHTQPDDELSTRGRPTEYRAALIEKFAAKHAEYKNYFDNRDDCYLAHNVLRKRLEEKYDETTGPLRIQHLMQLFAFCQRTFFTFLCRTYEQIKRTPKGSPMSNLVAELVLQEQEKVAFSHYKPAFWRRYLDDTCVIIEKDKLSGFEDLLNSIFPDIQFTREDEEDEKPPFLDVLVTRTPDGELNITVYRKATNTTQVLNYHSNHPLVHKRGSVRALFDRVKTHSTSSVFGWIGALPSTLSLRLLVRERTVVDINPYRFTVSFSETDIPRDPNPNHRHPQRERNAELVIY